MNWTNTEVILKIKSSHRHTHTHTQTHRNTHTHHTHTPQKHSTHTDRNTHRKTLTHTTHHTDSMPSVEQRLAELNLNIYNIDELNQHWSDLKNQVIEDPLTSEQLFVANKVLRNCHDIEVASLILMLKHQNQWINETSESFFFLHCLEHARKNFTHQGTCCYGDVTIKVIWLEVIWFDDLIWFENDLCYITCYRNRCDVY